MLRPAPGLRGLIERAIVAHRPKTKSQRERYFHLVTAIRLRSNLLSSKHSPRFNNRLFHSIARIAKWNRVWLRDPFSWNAPNANQNVQLQSLLDHLFVKYPVPKFMYQATLFGSDSFFKLFIRMGRGQSARTALPKCDLAFTMTKAMARKFMQAPQHLHALQAIGWAQIMAMGGSDKLAQRILNSKAWSTMCDAGNEELWFSFVRFMVRVQSDFDCANPSNRFTLGDKELCEIVTFIRLQRLRPAREILGYRTINDEPLQPNLNFEGRTLRSFRRLMRTWKVDLGARAQSLRIPDGNRALVPAQPIVIQPAWQPCSIGGFRLDGDDGRVFTIDEILTRPELNAEGGIMKHCVASYAYRVSKRHTTIWSLKVHYCDSRMRLLTIEVNPKKKKVVQVKGAGNRPPLEPERQIIQQWMACENLS